MEPKTIVTRREIWTVLLIAALLLLVTGLPYLYGYLSAPPDRQFMGIALGTPDTNQYFAWMRAFTRAPLISNTLTAEPNEAVFFNLLWWALAQLMRWSGLSQVAILQLLRILAGILFLVTAYLFCALLIADPYWRKVAFLVIALGAGFGWALVVGKYLTGRLAYPLDVYIVEPNTFLSVMAFPHFAQAAWLVLLVFGLTILAFERRQWRYTWIAAALAVILGWTHAYDLLLVYAILWTFALIVGLRDGWSSHLILYPAVITLLSCPAAFYSVYMTSAFPVWRQVLAQFVNADVWTPDPFHLLIVMGVPLVLALFTFDGLAPLRERSLRELFLKIWFGVNLFVAYFPVSYQIHYLNGWQIPVAILAVLGFSRRVVPWLQEQSWARRLTQIDLQRAMSWLLILAVVPTNVYLLAWRFVDLGRHQHPYYLYQDEVTALGWLASHTAPSDVVLSGLDVGQYIPGIAGNRAFLAHWTMTADFYGKQEMVQAFFDGSMPDDVRQDMLRRYDVRYVFHGSEEKRMGALNLAGLPYMRTVFSEPQATVYQVQWREDTASEQARKR